MIFLKTQNFLITKLRTKFNPKLIKLILDFHYQNKIQIETDDLKRIKIFLCVPKDFRKKNYILKNATKSH